MKLTDEKVKEIMDKIRKDKLQELIKRFYNSDFSDYFFDFEEFFTIMYTEQLFISDCQNEYDILKNYLN